MDQHIKKIADLLFQRIDPDYFPDEDQMAELLESCLKECHLALTEKVKESVPAILKSKSKTESSAESKRMRELAGIPHRGNFV